MPEAVFLQILEKIEFPIVFFGIGQQQIDLHLQALFSAGFYAGTKGTVQHQTGQPKKHKKQQAKGNQKA